jgi:hypothetical protein
MRSFLLLNLGLDLVLDLWLWIRFFWRRSEASRDLLWDSGESWIDLLPKYSPEKLVCGTEGIGCEVKCYPTGQISPQVVHCLCYSLEPHCLWWRPINSSWPESHLATFVSLKSYWCSLYPFPYSLRSMIHANDALINCNNYSNKYLVTF